MTTGERIKAARSKACLTQTQLAEKCGLATITIQQYERNKREPDMDKLNLISEALNINILYFLGCMDLDGYLTPEGFGDPDDFAFIKSRGLDDPQIREKLFEVELPEIRIKKALAKLNDDGVEVAIERIEELTEIPKYKKQNG